MQSRIVHALVIIALIAQIGNLPVNGQRLTAARSLTSTFARAGRATETAAATTVRLSRLPRNTITPIFNSVARRSVIRESATGSLASIGIRRQFSASVGSLSRVPRTLPAVSTLPAIRQGSYMVGRTASEVTARQAFRQAADIRKLLSPNLAPRIKATLGKSEELALSRAAAARSMENQALAVERLFNQRAALHKNSRFYRGSSHVYVIVAPDGRLYKVGESSAGLLNSGLSKRAQAQVSKLNRGLPANSAGYRSRIIQTFDSKKTAREMERKLILKYQQLYKDRRFVLPGNRERFRRVEQPKPPAPVPKP